MRKLILLCLLVCSVFIFSENRALVIGNANYSNSLGKLKNPVNDAKDISDVLEKIDFEVSLLIDGSKRDIMQAIRTFQSQLKSDDTALFYYAGHGVQIDGINYLIPVGADLIYESDAEFEAIEMDFVLSSLEKSSSKRNVIVFDACRNNELKKDVRSTTRGLAITQKRLPESMIIYSTSPGEVAIDGVGRNSPFAESFIKNIVSPNLSITTLVMKLTKDVKDNALGQTPWRSSSLTEDFYFIQESKIITSEEVKQNSVVESLIEESNTSEVYKYSVNGFDLEMVYVDAGSFTRKVSGLFSNKEQKVTLTENFIVSKFEVTQGIYKSLVPEFEDIKIGLHQIVSGDDYPIDRITWVDAIEFCNKLSRALGFEPVYDINQNDKADVIIDNTANGFRLPTNAQFEFIQLGGNLSKGFKYSGSDNVDDIAWYFRNSSGKRINGARSYNPMPKWKLHKVGDKKPNELGIYDLNGNVAEWCFDSYEKFTTHELIDPVSSDNNLLKVIRGGCVSSTPIEITKYITAGCSDLIPYFGFRVVRIIN